MSRGIESREGVRVENERKEKEGVDKERVEIRSACRESESREGVRVEEY